MQVALLLCCARFAAAGLPLLTPDQPKGKDNVTRYTMTVTLGSANPDCARKRAVILINKLFTPTIEVAQGDKLEITVVNKIPQSWPDVATNAGISIHWHGFAMKGQPWFDGTSWISQCPIFRGKNFTYAFTVNEPPGTYWWHDHSAANRADGLLGTLIVRPKGKAVGKPPANEHTMLLMDWWHYIGPSMAMRLNRPFDPAKVTNTSDQWCWVGLPRSALINGKGSFADCEDVYDRQIGQELWNGQNATKNDTLDPCYSGQLAPTGVWPKCAPVAPAANATCPREEFVVEPGSTNRFRLINGASLVYLTVCFEGHNVTVVAADARPVTPVTFFECVDVNSGQRLDVELKADMPPGTYWVSSTPQYRKGAPAAYSVLRYKGVAAGGLPSTLVPQPEAVWAKKWNATTIMSLKAPSKPPSDYKGVSWEVPQKVDQRFIIHITQPLFPNGFVRWALNNLANAENPPCTNMLHDVHEDPTYYANPALKLTPQTADPFYWPSNTLSGNGSSFKVLEVNSDGGLSLVKAKKLKAGLHTLTLGLGKVVEIVLQNNRAGAFGGEYGNTTLTMNRNGLEQHPFHLHGYHFFMVGSGLGNWSLDKVDTEYNTVNPALRDTATLLFNASNSGWTALRFRTSNPGVWPLHCHILAHHMMGQAVNLIVGADQVPDPPKGMPKCPEKCNYQMAQFTTPLTKAAYAANPLLAPNNQTGGD